MFNLEKRTGESKTAELEHIEMQRKNKCKTTRSAHAFVIYIEKKKTSDWQDGHLAGVAIHVQVAMEGNRNTCQRKRKEKIRVARARRPSWGRYHTHRNHKA